MPSPKAVALFGFSLPYVAFFFFPVALLIGQGVMLPTGEALKIAPILVLTILLGAASALVSVFLGLIYAVFVTENEFIGKRFMLRLAPICYSVPAILVALMTIEFLTLLGPLDIYGWTGVLFAHVFCNFPLCIRNFSLTLKEISRLEEKVALSLGASRRHVFWEITLRKIGDSILGNFLLVFLLCALSFTIVLMLGGGPRFTNLEVAIFQSIKTEVDLSQATRLALVQIALALSVLVVMAVKGERVRLGSRESFVPLFHFRSMKGVKNGFLSFFFLVVIGVPLGTLVIKGILELQKIEWPRLGSAFLQSVFISFICGFFTLFFSFSVAYMERTWKLFRAIPTLVMSVSTVILSLAIVRFYSLESLRGNLLAIALIQSLLAMPFGYRVLSDGLARIPEETLKVGQSLGAGPWRLLGSVYFGILRRPLVMAFVLGTTFSLGEIGVPLIFLSEDLHTLPIEIYRAFNRYDFSTARVAALVLVLWIFCVTSWTEERA